MRRGEPRINGQGRWPGRIARRSGRREAAATCLGPGEGNGGAIYSVRACRTVPIVRIATRGAGRT